MTLKPRPKAKKRRKRSLKGPDTKGDVIARCLSSHSGHETLRRLIATINDFKQQKILFAGLFEHMDVIEKMAFLADCDIPEDWRNRHLAALDEDEDAGA